PRSLGTVGPVSRSSPTEESHCPTFAVARISAVALVLSVSSLRTSPAIPPAVAVPRSHGSSAGDAATLPAGLLPECLRSKALSVGEDGGGPQLLHRETHCGLSERGVEEDAERPTCGRLGSKRD